MSVIEHRQVFDAFSHISIVKIIKLRWMRWVGHVAGKGDRRNAYEILDGKTKGYRPLRRPRRRWDDRNYFRNRL
jgi:hypothetical protein